MKIKLLPKEEWKPLIHEKNFKPSLLYAVSNYGRMLSYKKGQNMLEGRLRKPGIVSGLWYYQVSQPGSKKTRSYYGHRLVAKYFMKPPKPGQTDILHKDFEIKNNYVGNLVWATRKEWIEHFKKNPKVIARTEKHIATKQARGTILSDKIVKQIKRKVRNRKETYRKIGKDFGVSQITILNITKGRTWGHIKI